MGRRPRQRAPGGQSKNIGARSGGKTGRLHVRSVWGKLDPQGRRVRSKEGLLPSPLPKPADGVGQKKSKAAFRAYSEGENCMRRAGNEFCSAQAARAAATAPVGAERQARANAKNNARENGLSRALCSGCHCTPTTNRASGRLTASICPSGATASTRSPGAGRSIPWECNELTIISGALAREVRSPPAVNITLRAGPYGPPGESLRER